jgi:hypothetical protein
MFRNSKMPRDAINDSLKVEFGEDTVYWKLLSDKENDPKVYGDFKVWWIDRNFFIKLPSGTVRSKDLYMQSKRKKKGERKRHYYLRLGTWTLENLVGANLYSNFKDSYMIDKKENKRTWDRQQRENRKKALDIKALESGMSVEELKQVIKSERDYKSNRKKVLNQIDRTQRIMQIAPLLTTVRDDIDVILKQMAAGDDVNLGYPNNIKRKIKTFERVLRSIKVK